MRWNPICLAAVLITASLSAQVKLGESPMRLSEPQAAMSAQVELGESPTLPFRSPTTNGCPIGIVAERRSPATLSIVRTDSTAPRTQGIHLRFHHLFAPKIEQVTVIVHGLSQKSRIMPVDMESDSDVEETFQLSRAEQATSLTVSYLQPKRVFTTQWIELTSVSYTDGSIWHASHVAQCTVTPSKFVLATAR